MELFNYDQILYNEVIYKMEQEWQRKLTDYERHVLIEGYKFGRYVESQNEIRILDAK